MLHIAMRSVIIRGRITFCCFLVTRKRDEAGLCSVAEGWAGCCIIIIKKPRNLAESLGGWRSIAPVQGQQLCCWQTPRCHRTLLARPTGKATKGWATINALQFVESEPWINILTIRDQGSRHVDHDVPFSHDGGASLSTRRMFNRSPRAPRPRCASPKWHTIEPGGAPRG
jgi:hypothetical protein